jgi:GT2 family glycosyltransferase
MPGAGNAIVRKAVFEQVGLFDQTLEYGEDLQFFRRAARGGHIIAIAPEAIVYHIIPVERLERDYLMRLAKRGACSQATIDIEDRVPIRILWICFLRSIFIVCISFPLLTKAYLSGNPSGRIDRACSFVFSIYYIRTVFDRVLHSVFGFFKPSKTTAQGNEGSPDL